ncbi:hypothetical protein HOB10_03980 [Candidatus Parcubacteria bacterium]|jgi:hypothetical protein|nr:hypothetical protein [Candidatus Parcubacteria bacterium]
MIKANKISVIIIFRYIWLIVATSIIIYILGQAIVTTREIVYQIDNSDSITRDITGWYPEQRLVFATEDQTLRIVAEPLYLQAYIPVDFKTLTVAGDIYFGAETIRLGLKQADGTWSYRDIDENSFNFEYDLSQAQVKKNKLEMILSIPDLTATSTVVLGNNWSLFLNR